MFNVAGDCARPKSEGVAMKPVERIIWLREGLADCDEKLAAGDYAGAAAIAGSVADAAECACVRFNECAAVARSADNAEFGAHERWLGYAEVAAEIGSAACEIFNDCEEWC